ncbi:MAG: DUF1028 domain-containing protein [Phycisphaerae bacterium]
MNSLYAFTLLSLSVSGAPATTPATNSDELSKPRRPVSTYSIVARDTSTGEIGVAVQSHWFSVGAVVPWAEAGVGAVATQSLVDPSYGPLGLEFMRAGRAAPDALKALVAGDPGRAVRQVAMIDAKGRVAAHTGEKCIQPAGHVVDTDVHFSVQANLMSNETIWPSMAKAYRQAEGDLADRMIAALEAAQTAGGDIRGRQSAALLIVSGQSTGKPWVDRRFDLRVEDHPQPVQELKRLVQLQRAYLHMNEGDLAIEHKDFASANREYTAAEKLAPHLVEIPFWRAVTLASNDRLEEALPIFKSVFKRERVWVELVPRLVRSELLPNDPALIKKITAQAPK